MSAKMIMDQLRPTSQYHAQACVIYAEILWRVLLSHLSLDFVSLTVFYLLILVFEVRLTSAPMTCFIMYCQLVVLVHAL